MRRKIKTYYHTPLNLSKTIELPSNLLQKLSSESKKMNRTLNTPRSVPTQSENIRPKRQENVMLIQQKIKSRKSVLYKRLTNIKHQNQELYKYSYSKLLSKMVVVDAKQSIKSYDFHNEDLCTINYSCLRGKLLNMNYEDGPQDKNKNTIRYPSGCSDYSSRTTTKLFKRYYMPNNSKKNLRFFSSPLQQKYIHINGQKKQCKRIHNFYTSDNFRNSYDRIYGKNIEKTSKSKQDEHKSLSIM